MSKELALQWAHLLVTLMEAGLRPMNTLFDHYPKHNPVVDYIVSSCRRYHNFQDGEHERARLLYNRTGPLWCSDENYHQSSFQRRSALEKMSAPVLEKTSAPALEKTSAQPSLRGAWAYTRPVTRCTDRFPLLDILSLGLYMLGGCDGFGHAKEQPGKRAHQRWQAD